MENMDLNNAEVAVTTQHILDGKEYKDYWVQMSDYSDMGEFLCACSDLFPEETDPEYRYAKWENIPFGYDITTDDPHMMVSHYQDIYGNTIQETEEELADIADDALVYTGISGNFCDMLSLQYEIFDDNYN